MKIVFSTPLGLDIGQEVSSRKCEPITLAGAAAIAGGSALIGGISNWLSQSSANKANASLNKETRDWQSMENLRSRQWSEQMWNKENEYNTPLAQRKRLEEAGYNPWISGSGGAMSSVSQVPATGQQSSPPAVPARSLDFSSIANAGRDVVSSINDTVNAQAQSANQLSQAAQNGVNTAVALYEKTGDFDAAQEYLRTVLRSIGGANFSEDSMYFRQLGLSIMGIELENHLKELESVHRDLQNGITAKFGEAKASAELANLEQLTTKYVGELGLMSSQADLNRSEIKLNEDRAYELGARAAREFAEAGLLTSETKLNDGIRDYLIGNARIGFYQNKMGYYEDKATFDSRKSVRDWKVSPDSQSRQLWNYQMSPEANYVTSFMEGFTRSANVSFGVNANYNRSRSNSFTRGISDSRIFDMNRWGRSY